jgi:methyl-accepting chemotaxis protein
MLKILFFVWIANFVLNLLMKENKAVLISIGLSGLIIVAASYYFIFTLKKFGYFTMYFLISGCFLILSLLLMLDSSNLTTYCFLFLLLMVSIFYQRMDIIIYSGVLTNALGIIFFIHLKDKIFQDVSYGLLPYINFIFIGMTVIMISQAKYSEKLRAKVERDHAQSETQNRHLQGLIDKVDESIQTLDEFGVELNKSIQSTKHISDSASKQFSNVNDRLKLQKSDADHIDNDIRNINGKISNVYKSTQLMKGSYEETKKIIGSANKEMSSLNFDMNSLIKETEKSSDYMDTMTREIKKITKILEFLSSISHQSEMLSFNTNIEASRLGLGGATVNVIAKEMKKLSDDSKKATKDIEMLIGIISEQWEHIRKNSEHRNNFILSTQLNVQDAAHRYIELTNHTNTIFSQTTSIEKMIEEIYVSIERIQNGSTALLDTSTENMESAKEFQDVIVNQKNDLNQLTDNLGILSKQVESLKKYAKQSS